jgi:hypothetical protein
MRAFAKKKTHWKNNFYFTIRFMPQKLSRYYAKVVASTVMFLHSALFHDPFLKLQLFTMWDNGMDINSEDEAVSTIQ